MDEEAPKKRKVKTGEVYYPTDLEIAEYRSGVPPKEDSRVYRLVKKMSQEDLINYEKEYRGYVQNMDIHTRNYEIAYHKWFALRWEGENRNYWLFSLFKNEEDSTV